MHWTGPSLRNQFQSFLNSSKHVFTTSRITAQHVVSGVAIFLRVQQYFSALGRAILPLAETSWAALRRRQAAVLPLDRFEHHI